MFKLYALHCERNLKAKSENAKQGGQKIGRPAFAKSRLVRIGIVEAIQKTVCFFFDGRKGCINGFFAVHDLVDFTIDDFADLDVEAKTVAFGPLAAFFGKLDDTNFGIRAFVVVAVRFCEIICRIGDRNITGFFVPVVLGFRLGQEFEEFGYTGILFGIMSREREKSSAANV